MPRVQSAPPCRASWLISNEEVPIRETQVRTVTSPLMTSGRTKSIS